MREARLPLRPHGARLFLAASGAMVALAAIGAAQVDWQPSFTSVPGADAQIRALAVFDDGSGERLYAAGDFTGVNGGSAKHVARWDGLVWEPVGAGLDGAVHALAIFDDGTGAALYAGGDLEATNGLARWDGQAWSAVGLGVDRTVYALETFDDGSGEVLVVGGSFSIAGAAPANNVASWNGATWNTLGAGPDDGTDGTVYALAEFEDEGTPTLFVGGAFFTAGGAPSTHVARWDGSSWHAHFLELGGSLRSFGVFDDGLGSGPKLFAGGHFASTGGLPSGFVQWSGGAWTQVTGFASVVPSGHWITAMTVFDDGPGGEALYLGGTKQALRYDGATWTEVASVDSTMRSFAAFDAGAGETLFAAGAFTLLDDEPALRIARLADGAFEPLGQVSSLEAKTFAIFDGGTGTALYAAGQSGGGAPELARWTGKAWSPIDLGIFVETLEVLDDGSGPALYAGGTEPADPYSVMRVLRFDGQTWSQLGDVAITGSVLALEIFDDGTGPSLYAGGSFFGTGSTPRNIARWDGQAWVEVGPGFYGWTTGYIRDLEVFTDSSGTALYSVGSGNQSSLIKRWDGQAWSNPGIGIHDYHLYALTTHDDGTGPALYVSGFFEIPGYPLLASVASWKDGAWTLISSGYGIGTVYALASFDDGVSGPALFAGGYFDLIESLPAANIARWQGGAWSALGDGVGQGVDALLPIHDTASDAPALLIGGEFDFSPAGDSYVARWGQPAKAKPLWGCVGGPLTLTPQSKKLKIGSAWSAAVDGAHPSASVALLFAGFDGTDEVGCGLVLPDVGELLLAPSPLIVATTPLVAGSGVHQVTVPDEPSLAGLDIALHSAAIGATIELSNGLVATVTQPGP